MLDYNIKEDLKNLSKEQFKSKYKRYCPDDIGLDIILDDFSVCGTSDNVCEMCWEISLDQYRKKENINGDV